MAAALSIISLVIFFAPCACACAHSTPGNSVPASPIPEQVFMKFRRSGMVLPPLKPFFRRVRYHTNSLKQWRRMFLPDERPGPCLSSCKNVVRCRHLERSLHGALCKIVRSLDWPALELHSAAHANGDGRQFSRGGAGSYP